jgi:two-component system response regulator
MNNKPILLVEDNPDDEMFALNAFKKNNVGNRVVVARDGQGAIDYLLDTGQELPAFILLDLKLPKISGLEVLKRIRAHERTKFVPVIILTSSMNDEDLQASFGLGGNSYVVKSLDLERFAKDIGVLADYWLEVNILPSSFDV